MAGSCLNLGQSRSNGRWRMMPQKCEREKNLLNTLVGVDKVVGVLLV